MRKKIILTGKEAAEYFRVTPTTLRLWDKEGKIETWRTPGNTRRYVIYEDIPDEDAEQKEADKKAESEALNEERRRLQKQVAEFEAIPEEERSDLETGFIKFAVRPKLEELEKLCRN